MAYDTSSSSVVPGIQDEKCRPEPLHHVSLDTTGIETPGNINDVMKQPLPDVVPYVTTPDDERRALYQLLDKPLGHFDITLSQQPTQVYSDYAEFRLPYEYIVFGFVVELYRRIKWVSSYDHSVQLAFSRNCYVYDAYKFNVKNNMVRCSNQ